MVLSLRLVVPPAHEKHWSDNERLSKNWKIFFQPPWLLILTFIQLILILAISLTIVFPSIRLNYLHEKLFTTELCPDKEMNIPINDLDEILDFFDDFFENLDDLVFETTMQLFFVDPNVPFYITLDWNNGTSTNTTENIITKELLYHLKGIHIGTELYSISPYSSMRGCTRWKIETKYTANHQSNTFFVQPDVTREICPQEFIDFVSQDALKPQLSSIKPKLQKPSNFGPKKGPHRLPYVLTHDTHWPKPRIPLSRDKLPKAILLKHLSTSLMFISFLATFFLLHGILKAFKRHNYWRSTDLRYRDLDVFSQIHVSIGFWNPLNFLTEILQFISSAILFHESRFMTQLLSRGCLFWFAYSSALSLIVKTRWFILAPKLYQLVNVIKVSLGQIFFIFIGITPFIVATMFICVFLFGFVSNISKTYPRYIQLFLGLAFGDDLWHLFDYFTDGSYLYNVLSFIFVVMITILACYIFFPSLTATISLLHKTKVVPEEEREEFGEEEE